MILAAGLGTRLGELTRDLPKALIRIGGRSAVEHVARRLIAAGADRLIINVHHHADLIVEHVRERDDFGAEVLFSHEQPAPLETGGGLLHAARLFRGDAPFFLHNADVLCEADLAALYAAHLRSGALATLAVSQRQATRYLLFDANGLCGRCTSEVGEAGEPRSAERAAFAGIHVISPELLPLISERGSFSIIDVYLRLAAAGHRILAHDIGEARWFEIGSPARLAEARQALGG